MLKSPHKITWVSHLPQPIKDAGTLLLTRYQHTNLPFKEFITLMALMMSLVALSIDAVLPALSDMGKSLEIVQVNQQQLIISTIFIGMALGQLLFGPLSDAIGRRKSMLIGFLVFFLGSLMVLQSTNLESILVSRFIQGFGVAAPRVLSTAIIRDLYQGRAMARVMSFVMMIFILVPMIAPIVGQLILSFAHWRAIFITIACVGVIAISWFLLRQSETLTGNNKAAFTLPRIKSALFTIFSSRVAIGHSIAAGIISGPFIFYLSSAQQMFQTHYPLAQWFPLYFAGLSIAFGFASYINGKTVIRLGMHLIVNNALKLVMILSISFIGVVWSYQGLPPLWLTSIYLIFTFYGLGLLFGNLNALAMEPLGKIAGIGAAIVGSLSTLIAAGIAMSIGQYFNGTLYPLVISFGVAALISSFIIFWCSSNRVKENNNTNA